MDPLTTAAVIGGTSLLGGLLGGDQEQTTTINYDYVHMKVKLPSGATVTMYKQVKEGQTTETESGPGDILGNAITSAGTAFGLSQMYPSKSADLTKNVWA